MESMLGFKEHEPNDVVDSSFKLVPWMSWDEWKLVKGSLFSASPDSVVSALKRISTWRSRGCIPVAVDVTASIVEIQQKDPFFRNDLDESVYQSEEMLSMLYCMAIVRLVNGVVEKTREKNRISIGDAADALCIPRILIDIRHEGSHRDLPSLQLVRLASTQALDWLIWYYWEPQEKEIPVQNNKAADLKKEIKRSLRAVSLCLKAKQTEKSPRKTELVYGRTKFLIIPAGESSPSNSTGSKKQVAKALKNAHRLYSSFSTDVVYLLLEYLLNALETSNLSEKLEDPQNKDTAFDDWKSVVLELSRKEPGLLLILSQAVIEKMETAETMSCKTGDYQSPAESEKPRRFELLSRLFGWIVETMKTLNPVSSKESAETKGLPRATVFGLLRRCLLLSLPGNNQLMASAVTLAQLSGASSLIQKLKKLALLELPSVSEPNSTGSDNDALLSKQEFSIHQAEGNLELIKRHRMQRKHGKPTLTEAVKKSRWTVAKSWTPCPIGLLPHTIGFSGKLPTLDCVDGRRELTTASGIEEVSKQSHGKREAEISTQELDVTHVKKVHIEADCWMQNRSDSIAQGIEGHLMIDGALKKIGEQELLGIASAIKLLI